MRPVDKGEAPEVTFEKYQDAEPYLEERIGPYCSFCEFHIQHVPEVEHKEAKSQGGEELKWENLLLSCKYCNTRKGTHVKAGDAEKYLWPDEDDTFHVYSYALDIPVINEEYLIHKDGIKAKAENLYTLVKLGNIPVIPSDKDRRYRARREARNCAEESYKGWQTLKNTECKDMYLVQTIKLASCTGFFSVWMEVFKDEPEVKKKLMEAFRGTKKAVIEPQE